LKETNTTIIFGLRAVFEALASKNNIEKVFLLKDSKNTKFKLLEQQLREHHIAISYVPKERFERFNIKNHQGVVAQMSAVETLRLEALIESIETKENPLLILLDGVTDVRNFGAILRTASAVGVDGVILPSSGSAPLNGDVVKTSAGGIFHVPIVKVNHLKDAIYQLQELDFTIVAITEKASDSIYTKKYNGPIAVILGAEDKGISKGILKMLNNQVKIPMKQHSDSLNVSVASAVVLYEIVRQRIK
tara:strand:- start:1112 stop:1852 length:741 start_codon:yes stop_codon:yes gene_type:complete